MNKDYCGLINRIKREHLKAIQHLALAECAVTEKERFEHLEYAGKYSKRVASGIECYINLIGLKNA